MNDKTIKILLVEENPDDEKLIREMMAGVQGFSFELSCADTLSKGLQRLVEGGVDVVLLDLSLPDSHGFETFARVQTKAPEVPIVIMTGLDEEELAVEAVGKGAQDYFVKGEMGGNLLVRALRYAIERKRARDMLEASEARLKIIIEKNVDGIIVVDHDGKVCSVNPAAEQIFDSPAEGMVGEAFKFFIDPDKPREIEITRPEKDSRIVEMRAAETVQNGDALYVISLRDITELAQLREELQTLSLTDFLTGLYNRRGFLALGQQQLRLAKRKKEVMLLFYIDIDDMKLINDTHGHKEGDRVLRDTAEVLKETFRESDIVARIGGDEFAAFAIEAPGNGKEVITSRLKNRIDVRNALRDPSDRYKLSLSLGIVTYDPERPCSIDALMDRADTSMYQHKRSKGTRA